MKRKLRFLSLLLVMVLCFSMLSVTAFAKADDPEEDTTPEVTEGVSDVPTETVPPETTPPPTEPSATISDGEGFTEEGNAYTRDLQYDAATNKQFITIETKSGNVFYIVIDYDKPTDEDGEQYHTYFLNKVDEADILALLEDGSQPAVCSCQEKCVAGAVNTSCEVCSVNMTECVGAEPPPVTEPTDPTEEPTPTEPGDDGTANMLPIVVVLFVLIGGVAVYFVKFKGKNKPKTRGNTNLDDYDFGEDEDDEYAEFEQYDPESEGSK